MLAPNVLRSDAPEPPMSELDEARAALAAAQRTARMSSLISIASLLISGCAFVASISLARAGDGSIRGGTSLVGERPSTKALAPDDTHFRIEELAVYQENIVESAIGTPELQDACVTGAKLASGSVTADKVAAGSVSYSALTSDAVAQLTRQVSDDKAVIGAVAEDGTILQGSSFTVQKHSSQGYYTLTFTTTFAAPPVVVAVANTYGTCYCNPAHLTQQTAEIVCKTDLIGSVNAMDMAFNFYASVAPA